MKRFYTTLFATIVVCSVAAQSIGTKDYVYGQAHKPVALDNYLYSSFYHSGNKVYNLRGFQVTRNTSNTHSMKINPAGSSVALYTIRNNGKREVAIYDLLRANHTLHKFKMEYIPTAICYAPNARSFAIASADKKVHIYEARTYTEARTFDIAFEASVLAVSSNNYFLALSDGTQLNVYNFENGSLRRAIPVTDKVNFVTFSADNTTMAVLTNDGMLTLYDTRTFLPVQEFGGMGIARSCDFIEDGKYIAVVSGPQNITLINKYDEADRTVIDCANAGVTDVRFIRDAQDKEKIYLLYNTEKSIVYALLSNLQPNYSQLLSDEVNDMMNEWLKQMPGESLEEYEARVNDETRMRQRELFETEIATRMADNLLQASTVTLGDFNASTNMLALNFNTMPTIFLEVPQNEVNTFSSAEDLEFRNAQYGLMADDHFELVYVDVYNKLTQNTYTFDKRARMALEFEKSDEEIISLELVQRSNMEEMKLMEIREKVLEEAKTQNIVSDHTQIAVNTNIISDVNAEGENILNYEVGFSYNVEAGYSAKEDFGPGKYHTERSGAASSMIEIIKRAFESEFAQYVKAGKKVRIIVTGMADNLPINGRIAYDGAYGEFTNEPVYGDDLYSLTVTKASGITQNDQLAFMRAIGVKDCVEKNLPALQNMDVDYEYHVKLLDKVGGEYRRISVNFIFVDAF